jgi:branched-chain amino acid aminotransferase
MNVEVQERRVSIDEIQKAHEAGKLEEAFGAGTAATVSPVIEIGSKENVIRLPPDDERKIGPVLLKNLTDIRHGLAEDKHGWVEAI